MLEHDFHIKRNYAYKQRGGGKPGDQATFYIVPLLLLPLPPHVCLHGRIQSGFGRTPVAHKTTHSICLYIWPALALTFDL